ncbi:MAG: DNA-protecting protein DprA [Clostridiales bacterium]|nr:DNA-protecting protein DprA [Clostridiales bacterium]
MELSFEQRCLLWLSTAEIPAKRVASLTARYGSAEEIWRRYGEISITSAHKNKAILDEYHNPEAIDRLVERLEKSHVHLLFQSDDRYPLLLNEIQDPPYLLYYSGNLSCLQMPCIAVVGTRTPSEYGRHMARVLGRDLAQAGVCVVSGLARGIDIAAHQGVLDADGTTVGILGSGINVPYPSEHAPTMRKIAGGKGLILSEFPLDATPTTYHFPYRNRIISGLCVATVFVEGRIKSGGMHTVSSALDQGREVFAVPGQTGYLGAEGPLAIMREGARLITGAADILEDLAIVPRKQQAASQSMTANALSPVQKQIAELLRIEPMSIDDLSVRSGLNTELLISETGLMEIMGLIRREAGNRFVVNL